MLAHNTAVMAGVASIESKLDNELLFTDDGELSDHFDAVKKEVDDVQQNVDDVKAQVIEAHSHIEALIGLPADIPSINRRKRDGELLIGAGIILIVVLLL
jgi:t-SNARE complex subunit (syntaxin)